MVRVKVLGMGLGLGLGLGLARLALTVALTLTCGPSMRAPDGLRPAMSLSACTKTGQSMPRSWLGFGFGFG